MDKRIDLLHKEGRMIWSNEATRFGYPVFVVETLETDDNGRPYHKERVVIDKYNPERNYPAPGQYPNMPTPEQLVS